MTRLSIEQHHEIASRYGYGDNTSAIARDFRISTGTVDRIARAAGHPKRNSRVGILTNDQKSEATTRYLSGESSEAIGRSLGVTGAAIGVIVRKRGVTMRNHAINCRTKTINDQAFSQVTPDSAYWAGFLMADGSIRKNRNGVALGLATKDIDHVIKFRDFLGSNHTIGYLEPGPNSLPNASGRVTIEISSAKIISDLSKFGVTNDKTANGVAVGVEFNPHFWRGVVDGDGCISIDKNGHPHLNLIGNRNLVSQFREYTISVWPKTRAKIHKTGSIWGITIGHRPAYAITKALYFNAVTCLDRKKEIASCIIDRFREPYAVGRRRKGSF